MNLDTADRAEASTREPEDREVDSDLDVHPLSIKKNIAWNSAGSIVNLGLQWLLTVFVVRLSTDYEAAGILSLALSIYNIFAPFAIYRMYTYQVSDVNRENTVGEYFAFRIITCAIALICCALYSIVTCMSDTWLAIILFSGYKIASLLIDVLHGEDQLNGRMDYIGKSLMLQGALSFAAFCFIFFFFQTIELAIGGMIVSVVVVGLCYDLPKTKQFSKISISISASKAKRLLAYCLPITLASIACSAAPTFPRQYLAFVGGNDILGIYASVAAPVAIIQMGASYIYNPLLSVFATHYYSGELDKFKALLIKTTLTILCAGVGCAVGFEILGPIILPLLFGDSIAPYTYLLLPMVVLAILTALLWFVNDLLVAIRHFSASFISNMIAFVASLATTIPFVTTFNMNGVSFAGIAAYGLGVIAMLFFLIRTVKTKEQ